MVDLAKLLEEMELLAEELHDSIGPVDVWTGVEGFESLGDGRFRAKGGTHERLSWREYLERYGDEDD